MRTISLALTTPEFPVVNSRSNSSITRDYRKIRCSDAFSEDAAGIKVILERDTPNIGTAVSASC